MNDDAEITKIYERTRNITKAERQLRTFLFWLIFFLYEQYNYRKSNTCKT